MRSLWRAVSNLENQRTLTFIGTGVAAVVMAGWTLFLYLNSSDDISKNEVNLSPERFAKLIQEIETGVHERFEAKLEKAENATKHKELRDLQDRELALLRTRELDKKETLAEINRLLSEVSAAIRAPREALPSNEIEVANEHIRNGNFKAAESTLKKYSDKSVADAAQAEFLLGELAQNEVDLEKAAPHYRRAVRLVPTNERYRTRENSIYQVQIIYDSEMRDVASQIVKTLSENGINVETDRWNDYKEDDDGAMRRWVSGPTFLYGESTEQDKVDEYETLVVQSGTFSRELNNLQGALVKHGTTWTFSPLSIFLWLPNK